MRGSFVRHEAVILSFTDNYFAIVLFHSAKGSVTGNINKITWTAFLAVASRLPSHCLFIYYAIKTCTRHVFHSLYSPCVK